MASLSPDPEGRRLRSSVLEVPDDPEAVTRLFHSRGWNDGLPIIPPTRERVLRMLAGADLDPARSLGRFPPSNADTTIEKIAVNAVLAGCRPEYLPVLVAATDAILDPSFELAGMQPTTNPLTPMVIVNGPIRNGLDISSGAGVMGPGAEANATIGRALRLLMINLGGARPGAVDQCTQGFVGKFSLCVGENEEQSPWPPLHVEHGFGADENVVTVVGVNSAINIHDSSGAAVDLLKTLCGSLPSIGTPNVVDPFATPVLALNPLHARILDTHGLNKERLREYLLERTSLPADALSGRRELLRRQEGEEHFTVGGRIPLVNEPDSFLIVVIGGLQGGHSCFLPNGHYGHVISRVIG